MKAVVYTLGCKVNRTESEGIMAELRGRGYSVTDSMEPADLYIINTCAVTVDAERKSRGAVSRARALSPAAKIVVTGCSSQNDAEKYSGASLVTGNAGKYRLADSLRREGAAVDALPELFEEAKTAAEHTRAFIKIQDGCDNFCSYCIVPYLRGRSRSRGAENIFADIEAQKGVKEIVLTGINISKYGLDTGSSLTELITALKNQNKRLRLGSLEVGVINDELLTALKENKNFCPHFHLSLQSCEDGVLKDMNRRYTVKDIFAAAALIREYFPHAGITADIIAGFPTESEEAHNSTKEKLKKLALSDIHVFPFSPRPGTAAARMKDLPFEVKKRRAEELTEIKQMLKKEFLTAHIGAVAEILTEKGGGGLTKNYIRVYLNNNKISANTVVGVRLTELYRDGMKGELI